MGMILILFGNPDYSGANRYACDYASELAKQHEVVAAVVDLDNAYELVSALRRIDRLLVIPGASLGRLTSRAGLDVVNFLIIKRPMLMLSFLQVDLKVLAALHILTGTPFIYFAQNKTVFHGNWIIKNLKEVFFNFLLSQFVGATVACSNEVANEVSRRVKPVAKIENGLLNTVADLPRTASQPGVITIVNCARLDEQKGQVALIEAVSRLRSQGCIARLILVGDVSPTDPFGKYKRRIQEAIRRLDADSWVELPGWSSDVGPILAAADIYAQPSLWEGKSLAVLEALSYGLPVVYSDCAGTFTGFEHPPLAFVYQTGDSIALFEALSAAVKMIRSPDAAEISESRKVLVRKIHGAASAREKFRRIAAHFDQIPAGIV